MRGIVLASLLGACAGPPLPAQQQPSPLDERVDFTRRAARFDLPGRLREVSGLAFGPEGRLLAHNDEQGRVFRVDIATQEVDRGFYLGDDDIRDDFEGVARAGHRLFLVSSVGRLYEFRMAEERTRTPVRITDTALGGSCEIEGLTFHEETESLLAACKSVVPFAAEVRIHRLPLDPSSPTPPPIRVPFSALAPWGLGEGFHPSGITVDPVAKTLILVAAREEAIIEIDVSGNVLSAIRLNRNRHPQPEGVAVGEDGRIYIADEANGREARITVYAPVPEGALP